MRHEKENFGVPQLSRHPLNAPSNDTRHETTTLRQKECFLQTSGLVHATNGCADRAGTRRRPRRRSTTAGVFNRDAGTGGVGENGRFFINAKYDGILSNNFFMILQRPRDWINGKRLSIGQGREGLLTWHKQTMHATGCSMFDNLIASSDTQ